MNKKDVMVIIGCLVIFVVSKLLAHIYDQMISSGDYIFDIETGSSELGSVLYGFLAAGSTIYGFLAAFCCLPIVFVLIKATINILREREQEENQEHFNKKVHK